MYGIILLVILRRWMEWFIMKKNVISKKTIKVGNKHYTEEKYLQWFLGVDGYQECWLGYCYFSTPSTCCYTEKQKKPVMAHNVAHNVAHTIYTIRLVEILAVYADGKWKTTTSSNLHWNVFLLWKNNTINRKSFISAHRAK